MYVRRYTKAELELSNVSGVLLGAFLMGSFMLLSAAFTAIAEQAD